MDDLGHWRDALTDFLARVRDARFGGVVLDYDGTVVETRRRFEPADPDMVSELNRVAGAGVRIGIATGRGVSVRRDLQKRLPRALWPVVLVGYYNGAEIASLDDDGVPNGSRTVCDSLRPLADALRCQPAISSCARQEDHVEIEPRAGADAALTAIGGKRAPNLLERARKVELDIYNISASLMPPDLDDVEPATVAAYRPFDVIETFRIAQNDGVLSLQPLVVFDDAHTLHRDQLKTLRQWLSRRELKVSRWVLTRLDALTPGDVLLDGPARADESGELASENSREVKVIRMQEGKERASQRRVFRKMAKDMAGRYLRQMDVFNRRGLHSLGDLLSSTDELLPAGKCQQLRRHVDTLQRRYQISTERRSGLDTAR